MILTIIIVVGIIGIGALGVASSRRQKNMSTWTVGKRDFPKWTAWFLQAGESLTTFSFLGLAGIAFAGGVSAVFALGYLTMSCICMYFVAPRIRALGASRGYLTMADFFRDRYKSVPLAKIIALVGALFLIPYLQLQITGLGLIVELATGSSAARGFSMIMASILVIIFVAWSGIRGIAKVAILKDILMAVALVIVFVGVAVGVSGIPDVFAQVAEEAPVLLTLRAEGYDTTFFITAMLVTTIGAGFATFPHLWSPILAAESGAVLRSNYKWLAVYQLLLFIPITVGLAAVLVLSPDTTGNAVLLTLTQNTLPEWLVGIVAVAGASAAMVPAGGIAMGISALVSNNLLKPKKESQQMFVTYAVIIVAVGMALLFGLVRSDIGALLLLTYGGLTQMAPAVALALPTRVRVGGVPVMLGIITGALSVAVITFANIPIGNWDSGLISLAPNLLVVAVAEAVRRIRPRSSVASETPVGTNPDPDPREVSIGVRS
ncbi:sodium:solute symporter family protein [Lysinibacter sp. HNR]|uniref:sodium:solute symporter family protein n=1 Tax=Lysinibacter sp. HNR TaxID=3031408 RepID=UPI0024359EF8|nr:sodium:solute symporter family protein [Lysinibacter sp. HNR]WGD37808.1 sodium:solute symporter family protein [Lysinibacter sp. HNR]